ncbi:MAG: orotate phosphoribosyltransferase [Desulfovibrio sp.]|nr:orotate phosphoribosyltransferase [Desulfovibrio sp.]
MQDFENRKHALARLLYTLSYREGDFVLASGRRSSYYFDCRVTALHAEGSWLIGSLFLDLLKDRPIKGVGGMTMGADPLVSATTVLSHQAGRPLHGLLVRKEAKDHGLGQYVEGMGNFAKGDRVAVLEDVVTTGGSVLKACERLKGAGLNLDCVLAILDREEGGRAKLAEMGYELISLFTRQELLEYARQ